jgi:hypothetical protein
MVDAAEVGTDLSGFEFRFSGSKFRVKKETRNKKLETG